MAIGDALYENYRRVIGFLLSIGIFQMLNGKYPALFQPDLRSETDVLFIRSEE